MSIEQKIQKYFDVMKQRVPGADFLTRSKATILVSAQESATPVGFRAKILESLTAGSALALASILLLVVLGSVSYIGTQTAATLATNNSHDADAEALLREASQLVSSVQIKEVDQFLESSEQMVSALNALSEQLGR